jgi:hypothetical protein
MSGRSVMSASLTASLRSHSWSAGTSWCSTSIRTSRRTWSTCAKAVGRFLNRHGRLDAALLSGLHTEIAVAADYGEGNIGEHPQRMVQRPERRISVIRASRARAGRQASRPVSDWSWAADVPNARRGGPGCGVGLLSDSKRHAAGIRVLADAYFDSDKVLTRLLDQLRPRAATGDRTAAASRSSQNGAGIR